MRVCTISLNLHTEDFNYGGLLHSWAMQEYLNSLPFVEKTVTLDYVNTKLEGRCPGYPVKDSWKQGKHLQAVLKAPTIPQTRKRDGEFKSFIEENMTVSEERYTQAALDNAELDYDTAVCESDVIWHPSYGGHTFDNSYFLYNRCFSGMNKIAYAPSVGGGRTFSEEEERLFRVYLGNLDHISCREEEGKRFLMERTEKPVETVLDPVFLLDAEAYKPITAPPLRKKPYVLVFAITHAKEIRKTAREYARRHGLEVFEITMNPRDSIIPDATYTAGVEEFLSALRYASAVFTNSFHAICFSLLFEREFYVFPRNPKVHYKIAEICCKAGLSDRLFLDRPFKEQEAIDYTKVRQVLERERRKSQDWLIRALLAGKER